MAITLSNLRPAFGAKRTKKRVGRGLGSKGTTAGRGQKGQSSRSGVGNLKRLGMRHTMLATPKLRGFKSLAGKILAVNVGDLEKTYLVNEVVSPKTLYKKGLIARAAHEVKILASGELTHAVTVKNCIVSKAAAEKIEKAGGKIEAKA
jgi:large subunit ribosomal protein L15